MFYSQNVTQVVGNQWSLVQLKFNDSLGVGTGGGTCATSSTTCNVTVTSTGAGHLLVAVSPYSRTAGSTTLSNVTGGETWTHCAGANGCHFFDTTTKLGIDASYVLSATGGDTSFTCTFANSVNAYLGCGIFEYKWTGSTIAFDTSNGSALAACTSCSGTSLTIGGTSDVILQIGVPANTFTAISGGAGYTNPGTFYDGIALCGAINTTTGTAPTITQNASGTAAVMAIAFKGS